MKLTLTAIKNFKPKDKRYKCADGGGLHLAIYPRGSKLWRYSYRFLGKGKTLSIGIFPDVSLKQARLIHSEARKMLSEGLDPCYEKKVRKTFKQMQQNNTFKQVALEWMEKQKSIWSETHCDHINGRLNRYVFGLIGDKILPISMHLNS
jgi:hypothetical protein